MTRRIVTKAQRPSLSAGPGPDRNPGPGRAWVRDTVREDRRHRQRTTMIAIIAGVERGKVHELPDSFDHLRQMGRGRLLARFQRTVQRRLLDGAR